MNGGHDLGGMHGLGSIDPEPESKEPVFHSEWEKRVFALTLAAGFLGKWNLDSSRHARERQHPADYIRNTYYENWLAGLETLLDDSGLLSREEQTQASTAEPIAGLKMLAPQDIAATLAKGDPATMDVDAQPQFEIGEPVRVRNIHPSGHTRAPRYTRGKLGHITLHHGAHVFPDRNAHGAREGQHLYCVRFEASELWGEEHGHQRDAVHADLWESHLRPAG